MSMLAERKRKQKFSLNPRGNNWSKDSSKFGQKLLEKMGWSEGKGLGTNLNGITEHVRVDYKNDSKGMGYKESTEQWTEHEDNFGALLQNLTEMISGETVSEAVKPKSLEQKSLESKVRVHYQKFTRGKDVTRYSEKDLVSIFGKRSPKSASNGSEVAANRDETVSEENFGVHTSNAGSMVEYFRRKMASFKGGSGGVLCKSSDAEGNNDVVKSPTKRKVGFVEDEECGIEKKKLKKSGSKKREDRKVNAHEEPEPELGTTNPAFDPLHTNITVQRHVLNTIEEDECEDSSNVTSEQIVDEHSRNSTPGKVKMDKSKLEVSRVNGLSNPFFDDIDENVDISKSPQISIYEVSRKKTKKKGKVDGDDSIAAEDERSKQTFEDSCEIADVKQISETNDNKKKKKKKQKEKLSPTGLENPIFEEGAQRADVSSHFADEITISSIESSNITVDNPYEVKRKDKKKRKSKNDSVCETTLGNPAFETTPESSPNADVVKNPYEVTRSNKKLKKSRKNVDELDNPAFEAPENRLCSMEVLRENPLEVTRKKKKKQSAEKHSTEMEEVHTKNMSKKRKVENSCTDNPAFSENSQQSQADCLEKSMEVSPKKKFALDNPAFSENAPAKFFEGLGGEKAGDADGDEECDLMLNIVSTPILPTVKDESQTPTSRVKQSARSANSSIKRRKSVRFSDVNQEHIIPNRDEASRNELFGINAEIIDRSALKKETGNRNGAFNLNAVTLEENVSSIHQTIDKFQVEVENDINEEKQGRMVGFAEVSTQRRVTRKKETVVLKFEQANLRKGNMPWLKDTKNSVNCGWKSYKHLIHSDIVLRFRNTNLHAIDGYGRPPPPPPSDIGNEEEQKKKKES